VVCGIVAIHSRQQRVSESDLQRATLALRHRGPDAQRHWTADHGRVGLGHSRLSIIDLQTGDQPLADETDRHHLVVNGEFYGFEEIRSRLEAMGHRFRTRSDSEIALHLYEEYGVHSLHHLRGEFAFALWDEANQLLFAARDRFGIKPLYYAVHEGTLYLGSEVKALFAAGVPARWDHETLAHVHRVMLVHPPDRSFFAGVYQLPPGHYLLATGTHLQILPYWDFNYPLVDPTPPARDPREQVEELRHRLHEAVRLRMRADVPVSCYLSGGLDSCAVLGVASQHASRPLRAYTLCFDHADYDESALAEEMAARAGAEFFPIPMRSEQLAESFSDALWHAERPFFNPHCVAKFLLSRAVRDAGHKVVLTGEGSDEVFAGYAHFRRDMVLHNTEGQDPETARRLLQQLEESNPVSRGLLIPTGQTTPARSVQGLLGFTPSFLETWAQSGEAMWPLLNVEFAGVYQAQDTFRAVLNGINVHGQLIGREPVHQSLYLWAKTALPNYVLSNLGDRMEMSHSVEGRLPFLDHHLVEAVAAMPVAMKIQGMTEKHVLREAAQPVLTDAIYRRQKHPFLSPPTTLQPEGAMFELVQDTLRGSSLQAVGIYDHQKVVQLLDKLPTLDPGGSTLVDPTLITVLSVCLLQERFQL
jgi:asparagine synthase (glutamine-hydrolysing)